jgi:DNA primase
MLYNGASARQAAHDGAQVIAVEGYVDVIAMVTAGFPATVAPLGTALTEDQLALLWKLADEPVLCFDGDAAGRRAAYRAVDLALPKLAPGKSLLFASLPEGQDPDDLARRPPSRKCSRPRVRWPRFCGRVRPRLVVSTRRSAGLGSKCGSTR